MPTRNHTLLFLQVGHMFRISMLGSILADHIICEPLTPFLSCTSSLPVGEFRRACGQGGAEEGGKAHLCGKKLDRAPPKLVPLGAPCMPVYLPLMS